MEISQGTDVRLREVQETRNCIRYARRGVYNPVDAGPDAVRDVAHQVRAPVPRVVDQPHNVVDSSIQAVLDRLLYAVDLVLDALFHSLEFFLDALFQVFDLFLESLFQFLDFFLDRMHEVDDLVVDRVRHVIDLVSDAVFDVLEFLLGIFLELFPGLFDVVDLCLEGFLDPGPVVAEETLADRVQDLFAHV